MSKGSFLKIAMRDLSLTLCRGITWQVLAAAPLRGRLNGYPVGAQLPVLTEVLIPVAGGPSGLPLLPTEPLTVSLTREAQMQL